MAKNSNGGSSKHGASARSGVSPARLHQQSGSNHAFGGYAKVNHNNGTFSMRRTGK